MTTLKIVGVAYLATIVIVVGLTALSIIIDSVDDGAGPEAKSPAGQIEMIP